MIVVGREKLEAFAQKHATTRKAIERFTKLCEDSKWNTPQEMKETFGEQNFDTLKGDAYIINVGGNKARVLVSVRFVMETVIIENVWTHAEYDKQKL